MCLGQRADNDRLVGYIKGCLFVKVGLLLTQCMLHSLLFCIVVTSHIYINRYLNLSELKLNLKFSSFLPHLKHSGSSMWIAVIV